MKKLHEAADGAQKRMRRTLVLAGASLILSVVLAFTYDPSGAVDPKTLAELAESQNDEAVERRYKARLARFKRAYISRRPQWFQSAFPSWFSMTSVSSSALAATMSALFLPTGACITGSSKRPSPNASK